MCCGIGAPGQASVRVWAITSRAPSPRTWRSPRDGPNVGYPPVAGVLLIAVGVLVVTNYYVVLNSWAVSLTPDWLLKRL